MKRGILLTTLALSLTIGSTSVHAQGCARCGHFASVSRVETTGHTTWGSVLWLVVSSFASFPGVTF